jgi:hypothetical protein
MVLRPPRPRGARARAGTVLAPRRAMRAAWLGALCAIGCTVGELSVDAVSTHDAGRPSAPPPPIEVTPRERCGSYDDEDADGSVDEGCSCELDETRECFAGDWASASRGTCRAGAQRCTSAAELGAWSACEGAILPREEDLATPEDEDCDGRIDEGGVCSPRTEFDERAELCANGHDDDCDGAWDCDDSGCADAESCLCTPIYWRRWEAAIDRGDAGVWASVTCEHGVGCAPGEVAIESSPSGGSFVCVERPPSCPAEQEPRWDDGWSCADRCELVVTFGHLFDGRVVCAPSAELECPSGELPTFVAETERWECRPRCDNISYDVVFFEGREYCVPC